MQAVTAYFGGRERAIFASFLCAADEWLANRRGFVTCAVFVQERVVCAVHIHLDFALCGRDQRWELGRFR